MDQDFLLPLERGFPEKYRDYYGIKRNNMFAGVTNFPDLWSCFMQLDEIFLRELEHIQPISDPDKVLPVMLFAHAHAQYRIFLEIGFTGAFCESFNVARMAIESAYQACKIISTPGSGSKKIEERVRQRPSEQNSISTKRRVTRPSDSTSYMNIGRSFRLGAILAFRL